jgi:hypothetical protein
MIFADLQAGESIFLDATTLVYHFGPHAGFGPVCYQLLWRIETGDIAGFTSTAVLSELAHRTKDLPVLFG